MNAHAPPQTPLLDLDLLKTLVAIADTGNFSAAAEAVFRTPSAISMQVKRIEELLGRPVFVRAARSVTLNEDGKLTREGLLLFLDFEKAFDRVDHKFMIKTLDEMGFPVEFTNWVQLLYKEATSQVRINNANSSKFKLLSGVRQGCPLSPLLFACVVECMANLIRQDGKIKGIQTPMHSEQNPRIIKISQYADDTVLILRDFDSLFFCKNHIETFCKASGMSLNKDKTEGMWLGRFSLDERWFNMHLTR